MGELKIAPAGVMKQLMPGKYVNTVLINVFDNCIDKKTLKYSIEMLKWSNTTNWILDCGGFTLLQYEEAAKIATFDEKIPIEKTEESINLAPIHVIQAASALSREMSDTENLIVMALDRPIKTTDNIKEQYTEFLSKIGFNIVWAKETATLKNKLCPNAKLYLPIQAYTIDQFEIFWETIHDINFHGLSMPVRNLSTKQLALFLIRFYQLGIKEIHLLGTTKPLIVALAAFMAKHLFDWVSLDATTWQQSARTANYTNHHDLSSEFIGDVNIDETITNDCPCPYCHEKNFADIRFLPDTEKTYFLGWHNFWAIENFGNEVFNHCDSIIKLRNHLFTRFKPKRFKEIERLCKTLAIVKSYRNIDINLLEKMLIAI